MVFDVLRGYLHVATGLSDVTKQRAKGDLAEAIVTHGLEASTKSQEQVQLLTEEMVESSRTNRDLLTGVVRTEVDRAVNRMGFVREDELAAVRQHVNRLEGQLQKEHQRASDRAAGAMGAASKTVTGVAGVMATGAARVAGSASSAVKTAEMRDPGAVRRSEPGSAKPSASSSAASTSSPETPAKDSTAKKSAAKKTPAKKTPAKKTPAKKTPAKKTPAKKTPAKKTPAKTSAKKASAKKATTRKSAAKKGTKSKAPAKKAPAKKTSAKRAAPKKATSAKKPVEKQDDQK